MIKTFAKTELNYEDFGRGPAVVILHDFPSNREMRQAHFGLLSEVGCRVVITNPGGLGRNWTGVDAEECSRRVVALLNYLGVGRALVVGISAAGYALLDLMQRFPARVAAASFVVSPELAADLRRRAKRPDVLAALSRGCCDDLKEAFLARRAESPDRRFAPLKLHRLHAWIGRVCRTGMRGRAEGPRDCSAMLDAFDPPPLLVETGEDPGPAVGGRSRKRRGAFRMLNAPLTALVEALLPPEECFEEEVEIPGEGR